MLIVFEDVVPPVHSLRVARKEMARAGVNLPLWVASREDPEATRAFSRAWRSAAGRTPAILGYPLPAAGV